MRAALRWIRADLRSHRANALLVVLATGGTVAALLLAGTLLGVAARPWQQQFRLAGSPDVRIDIRPSAAGAVDVQLLARQPGVAAVLPEQRSVDTTLTGVDHGSPGSGGPTGRTPLVLRADTPGVPRPLLRSGSRLDPSVPDGIVLDQSAAEAAWARPGDRLTVLDAGGSPVELRVVGIADSPDQLPASESGYDLGWTLPGVLDLVQPDRAAQGLTLGLKLDQPADARYVAQRAVSAVGADRIARITTWLDARASREQDNRLAGLLLGLSGLACLLAAALAVAGAAGGRITARTGDIALLKSFGFTAGQVVRTLIAEQLLLAGTGAVLGTAGAALAARFLPDPAGTPSILLLSGGSATTALVTATALAAIGAAAAMPALRAARVVPVPPVDDTRPRPLAPRPARVGGLLRLPAVLVLGIGGLLRGRSALVITVARLAVTVVAATLALSTWSTLDAVTRPDGGAVTPYATARRTTTAPALDDQQLARALAADPAVAGAYPGVELQALAPGQSATLTLRAVGTTDAPYPYTVVEGRPIRAADEAVAGQGALDLLDARVGQWVRVTTAGTPRILHIVGRNLEPEHGGRVLSTGFDTLDRPGDATHPDFWRLALRPGHGTLPALAELGGQVELHAPPGPVARPTALRVSVIGLLLLLGLISLVELMTTTAAAFHSRRGDLGLLRAIGLTPRQIAVVIATRGTVMALAAVALGAAAGIPLALWLIDRQGAAAGIGAGLAHGPSPWSVLALAALSAGTAAALSARPVLRGRRTRADS